jgi:hypothetical protein
MPGSHNVEEEFRVTDALGMPIEVLLSKIKYALVESGVVGPAHDVGLDLVAVDLKLKAYAERDGGLKIKFRIPFIGTDVQFGSHAGASRAHTIEMSLTPPVAAPSRALRGQDSVEGALTDAIATIRDTMLAASAGDLPWVLSDSRVEIAFGVTRDGTFSVGVDASSKETLDQTLTLRLRGAS